MNYAKLKCSGMTGFTKVNFRSGTTGFPYSKRIVFEKGNNQQVTIISAGLVNTLPITLAGSKANNVGGIGQLYCVSFAPSLTAYIDLIRLEKMRSYQNINFLSMVGVDQEKLASAQFERDTIEHLFNGMCKRILTAKDMESLCADYWHFATHGRHNTAYPIESYFELPDGKTKFHIVEFLKNESTSFPPRLVTLSACDLAADDFTDSSRDYNSFPNALFQVGALGTIASIWPVNDEASALLMMKFYDEHLTNKKTPSKALKDSQNWLATSTAAELKKYIHSKTEIINNSSNNTTSLHNYLDNHEDQETPFSNPIDWAGFLHFGV